MRRLEYGDDRGARDRRARPRPARGLPPRPFTHRVLKSAYGQWDREFRSILLCEGYMYTGSADQRHTGWHGACRYAIRPLPHATPN